MLEAKTERDQCRLLVELEDAGVGNAARLVAELEGIEATGEVAEIKGIMFDHVGNIFDHFA